jgi:hypothetical protein
VLQQELSSKDSKVKLDKPNNTVNLRAKATEEVRDHLQALLVLIESPDHKVSRELVEATKFRTRLMTNTMTFLKVSNKR